MSYQRTSRPGGPGYTPNASSVNLKAWSADPAGTAAGGLMVAATHYVTKVFLPTAQVITNVVANTTGAATTAASGYVALYDTAGNLIAGTQSADVAASWNAAAGPKLFPLGAPVTVADWVYVSVWINSAATMPTTARSGSQGAVNMGTSSGVTSATSPRYGTAANPYTTSGTVAPATLGTVTVSVQAWVIGLS